MREHGQDMAGRCLPPADEHFSASRQRQHDKRSTNGNSCQSRRISGWLSRERLLLINPWIHDFAAYDFWLRPMGLLYLAGTLRKWGFEVHFADCLDRYDPRLLERQKRSSPKGRLDGRGKFHKEAIPKPPTLRDMPRPKQQAHGRRLEKP